MLHDAEAAHVVPVSELIGFWHIAASVLEFLVVLPECIDQPEFYVFSGTMWLVQELPLKRRLE